MSANISHKGLLSAFSNWFNRYRDIYVEAQLKVETSLRDRLSEKDQIIMALENELAQAKAKIERMEFVLMPLSSHAGAAYVATLKPPKPAPANMVPIETSSWNAYLKKHIEESDRIAAEEEAKDK